MPDNNEVINIVLAGLGGQGVIKASDILSTTVFDAGFDVKKSEIHGMSQRGGSVTSDIRYGKQVFSPMVPAGEADYLVVLDLSQIESSKHMLKEGGVMLTPALFLAEGQTEKDLAEDSPDTVSRRNLNVALMGALSAFLDITEDTWLKAVFANLPKKVHEQNAAVFRLGRDAARQVR